MVTHPRRVLLTILLSGLLALSARAQLSLTTNFTGNTGSSCNMFEVKSLTGVLITGLDIHFTGTATFEVWTLNTPGTYLGNETSNANWTLQGTAPNLVSLGMNTPTPMGLNLAIPVPAGVTQSLYVTMTAAGGGTVWYNASLTQGTLHASNADLEVYVGNAGSYFGATIVGRGWNGTIYYSPLATVADDAALSSIDSPTGQSLSCNTLSAAEMVSVTVRNTGINPITAGTSILLSYQIDNGLPVTETVVLPNALTTGQTINYTFLAAGDFSSPGPHTLSTSLFHALDLDPSNDLLTAQVDSGPPLIVSYPYVETFNSVSSAGAVPPLGWAQDPTDGSGSLADWTFTNGPTPTGPTGPSGDLDGSGYYAYVEDDGELGAVNLRGPCLDLSSLVAPRLAFFLYSQNANTPTSTSAASFSVDVIAVPSGTVTAMALGPIGHVGTGWTYQFLDLSPWAGQSVQLVFSVNTANGSNLHDIAIDDVAIFDPLPTPGQAPQQGLAVMNINDSRNGNLAPVAIGGNGPYYATAQVGGFIDFQFEGEANRPIVLIAGPLNPVAATFPSVGQFDIGGPINMATGIPSLLTVLADGGNAQGLNAFFVLGPTGGMEFGLGVPSLPAGVLAAFQAAIFTSGANGAPVALSNAIQLTIN